MLSELCVKRPVFATMLVMSLVVLGIFSFRDLGVDLFPRADPATVNVRLSLPGASPDEISSSVIEPMEEAISGVSGIDEISARINEGGGNITVRFVLERDPDRQRRRTGDDRRQPRARDSRRRRHREAEFVRVVARPGPRRGGGRE